MTLLLSHLASLREAIGRSWGSRKWGKEVSSDAEATQNTGMFPKLAHCVLSSYCPTVMVLV